MPNVPISTLQITKLLQNENRQTSIITPLGNTLLEIQGDLELPHVVNDTDDRFDRYKDNDTVRFGLLSIDDEKKTATLFIGKKQRLLGNIVALDPPLGILQFHHEEQKVEMVDIIEYKIYFKDRPLPIM
ncbi:hypothetical protein KAFR_0B06840 [Kazachstania africana CBS 2517]|uniref:Chromosome transmission fidelity protein 8 n=1 Tax=Kazachstania africana (strain ATCC 22294 / BCRC 22015 / CBS 2517 / CECT 1963 / NBRC 1671 / NRRL Y-8276) TaxID=1071382 RepID=H2ARI1_KAZAF|nr:hypothetical protein KAFR_0B06840 [Kazachstania africana CBS 2517]CCF56981.1 hypothetical protein KAFR_0B06840 [Kazachstania africana CBS 2517]